jgi:hypothetical protein
MDTQAPGVEHRLTDLETQIERLTTALQQWRNAQDHLEPMERRFSQLTDQCADILKQWTATGERHAHAVGELESRLTGWNDIEGRLQRDASWRFQSLERAIEREWASLRHIHEDPARQLRAHAESLTEICVTTAGSAQTGLERAEARLALLESDLHRRMDELSRDVRAAVAELRHRVDPSAVRATARPWQLDEVTRLHQELRERDTARGHLTAGGDGDTVATPEGPAQGRERTIFDSHENRRHGESETESGAGRDPVERGHSYAPAPRPDRRWWYLAVTALALGGVAAGALAVSFYRQAGTVAARASEALQNAEHIALAADARIEAAKRDAAQQIAQARDAASKAQITSDVLAAPDLMRFNLTGGDGDNRYGAQLLFSRSRGMVFSGSRLPPPPPGATYQIWLLTPDTSVSAGTFAPDTAGRVTETSETPNSIPRPVVGVRVTLETSPGARAPSGTVVLARAQ